MNIVDPKVEEEQIYLELSNSQSNFPLEKIKQKTRIFSDNALEACKQSHAIVVCTEWDIFKSYNYEEIYGVMQKPAFIFDGRLILDHRYLTSIGFHVEAIGKRSNSHSY